MLKTPSFSRSVKKRNPSLLKVFKKGGKDGESIRTSSTAPNTPEEETGVTVVANEIDPSLNLSPLTLQQIPSPLRGDHRSFELREEKKEERSVATAAATGNEIVDVVSKTLNFFDDMCAIPEISDKPSIAGTSMKKHSHLLTDSSHAGRTYDDNTTSPSIRSEFTGGSSLDPSRYSNSYMSSLNNNNNNKLNNNMPRGGIPSSPSHDHENFEVVLDPASILKEEKPKPIKQPRGKRWPRLSKSLSSSLSLSASTQKKEKQVQQTSTSSNNNNNASNSQESSSKTVSKSASAIDTKLRESPIDILKEDEMPLDEEIAHLAAGGTTNNITEQQQETAEVAEDIPEYKNRQEHHPKSKSGTKVLAKKIWKNCKKIPIPRQKGEQHQQHHRAEVDNEAAVARSLEANNKKRADSNLLEEQEFLQQGCPKQGVEPIMEESESSDDDRDDGDERISNKDEQHSSMAKTWNNIFTSITNTLDPEASAGNSPGHNGANETISLSNNNNSESSSRDASSDLLKKMNDQQQLGNEEALATAEQSVEVSANKKLSTTRSGTLGHRLKKIQKSAYFKSMKKSAKKDGKQQSMKTAGQSKDNDSSASSSTELKASSIAPPAGVNTEKFTTGPSTTEIPKKPKVIWKAVLDQNSGRTYYYHRKTRETTWTKPDGLKRYEIANKKWLEATAAAIARDDKQLAEVAEMKIVKEEETKKEEKALPVSVRSASWPKTSPSSEAAKDEKINNIGIIRTLTPPVERTTGIPHKMTDNPEKEAKKPEPKIMEEKDVSKEDESNNGEKKVTEKEKETKVQQEKKVETKQQPFDELKPFDEFTPFDEPLVDSGPGLLFLPRSPQRFGRNMTYMSKASHNTRSSALTDRTEKIKNTGKGKLSSIDPITENMSTATSLSSHPDNDRYNIGRGKSTPRRVPSRVPVIRERQLMVEELTDARISAESYEGNAGEKRGRIVKGRPRRVVEATQDVVYDADNDTVEDYGASTFDNETYGTDSVSALSENDTDFLSRRDNFDQARRRALDAAIDIEDWDLAAALSDGMRAANLPGGFEKAHSSWNQSELDKFIANNDWNAVKSYIAKMREQSKKEQVNRGSSRRKGQAPSTKKSAGVRSQLQHREMVSESSWSGSDSQSSYETYDTESEI